MRIQGGGVFMKTFHLALISLCSVALLSCPFAAGECPALPKLFKGATLLQELSSLDGLHPQGGCGCGGGKSKTKQRIPSLGDRNEI